jgi:hypothetical protein
MQYAILIYDDEAAMQAASAEDSSRLLAAYGAYIQAMTAAGIVGASSRLRPTSTATTVRIAGGKTQVLDGPYADTKEQLAGFFIIDVPDLDAALSWAQRCPGAATGVVEVRPVWQM